MNFSRSSPIRVTLPQVEYTEARPRVVFERKTAKFGLFAQLLAAMRPKSSSTVKIRRRGVEDAEKTASFVDSDSARQSLRRSISGNHASRSVPRNSSPLLSLQGRRPPFRDTHCGERSQRVISDSRLQSRISALEQSSDSSDEDLTDVSPYETLYPRLGADYQMERIRVLVRKKQEEVKVRVIPSRDERKMCVYFRTGLQAGCPSPTREVPRGHSVTLQLTKPCAWLSKCLSASGATVAPFLPTKNCQLLLSPTGNSKHLAAAVGRKYNHIPGCNLLFRRVRLYETIKELGGLPCVPVSFHTVSETYSLLKYRALHPKTVWLSQSLDTPTKAKLLLSNFSLPFKK